MLTAAHFEKVLKSVPGAFGGQKVTLQGLADWANVALVTAGPTLTREGAAAFLGTLAQESGSFRYLAEAGSSSYLKAKPYYPYTGRSFVQITWKSNYAAFGKWAAENGLVSDPDLFVKTPQLLSDPEWAWEGGVWFFQKNGLWSYANRGEFLAVSRGVNLGNPRSTKTPVGQTARTRWYNAFLKLGNDLLPTQPVVVEPDPTPAPSAPVDSGVETPTTPEEATVKVSVIEGGTITTPYGYKANDPKTGKSYWAAGKHPGDDWNTPGEDRGKPAYSAVTGKVVHAGTGGWGSAYGKHVIVQSPDGKRTAHCHFNSVKVSVNQIVVAGDQIGTVGSTGHVTGPHVHVERRRSPFAYNKTFEKPVYEDVRPRNGYKTPKTAAVYTSKLVDGSNNSDSVFWVQLALGIPLTGNYDDFTQAAAKREQQRQGSSEEFCDGFLGLKQTKALFKKAKLPLVVKEKP